MAFQARDHHFQFRAYSKDGFQTHGELAAATLDDALYLLQGAGYTVTAVSPIRTRSWHLPSAFNRLHLPQMERLLLCYCLAASIEAGIPVQSALLRIRLKTRTPSVAAGIDRVQQMIDEGATLTEALAKNRLIPSSWVNLLSVGEKSGDFPEVLLMLYRQAMEIHKLREELFSVLFLPSVLLILIAVWYWLFTVKVIPSLAFFLAQLGVPLSVPVIFRLQPEKLLIIARLILCALGAGVLLFLCAKQANYWGRGILRYVDLVFLPGIGPLIRQVRFLHMVVGLRVQIEAGIPLVTALWNMAQGLRHPSTKRELLQAYRKLQEGVPVAAALVHVTALPPMAQALIATGDSGGRLPEILDFLAREAASVLREQGKRLGILTQNFVILSIGILFGFLVVTFFTLFYSTLGNLLQGVFSPNR